MQSFFTTIGIGALLVVLIFCVLFLQARSEVPQPVDFLMSMKSALNSPTALADGLTDADGDLTADAPQDSGELLDPDTLVFEVLGADLEREREHWSDFIAHLEKATGKKVELAVRTPPQDASPSNPTPPALQQARDFRDGKLHLACVNTGAVSLAVNLGGAMPFCVMAANDGDYGYEMEIIVPAKSAVKSPAQLKGARKVLFASAYSHSAFKAPLMTLWKEFNLQPERDFTPVFVAGQEAAIKEIGTGRGDAAPVASDLLQRLLAQDVVKADAIRSIYKSPAYPPACFAYAHQLQPELAAKVKAAFLDYDWKGTSLEKAYAAAHQSKFVATTYKDAWASVREVEAQAASLIPVAKPVAKAP